MDNQFQDGDEVEYLNPKTGKWKQGVVHGVRKIATEYGEQVLSYLVDTGEDERIDELPRNLRVEAIGEEIDRLIAEDNGLTDREIVDKAHAKKGLPKDKTFIDTFRQPETIDIKPEEVRPRGSS
jgi:hypothetical protein